MRQRNVKSLRSLPFSFLFKEILCRTALGEVSKKSVSIGSGNDAAGTLVFFALFVTIDYSASD